MHVLVWKRFYHLTKSGWGPKFVIGAFRYLPFYSDTWSFHNLHHQLEIRKGKTQKPGTALFLQPISSDVTCKYQLPCRPRETRLGGLLWRGKFLLTRDLPAPSLLLPATQRGSASFSHKIKNSRDHRNTESIPPNTFFQ